MVFRGSIEIAVMDNGFQGMDNSGYLAQARNEGRIIPVYDFVDDDSDVFSEGSHGSLVLGTMLGYFEGQIIGASPLSKAYLFITGIPILKAYMKSICGLLLRSALIVLWEYVQLLILLLAILKGLILPIKIIQ